jgi:hypothetical protein
MATLEMADNADLTASASGYTPGLHGANQTAQPPQPQQQPPQQNFRPRFNVQQKETRQIGPIRIQSAVASFVFKGEDRFDMWRCMNYGDASSSSATTIIEDEHDFSDDDSKDYDDGNSINSSSKPSSSSSKFKCKLDRAKKRYLLTSSPTPPPAAAARAVTVLSPPISPARDDHISIGTPNRDNDGHHHHQPQLLAYAGVFDGHSGPAASEYCANKGLLSHIVLETAAQSTTTTNSTNSSTTTRGNNRTTAWAIGGGGVHNKGPHIEVPWLSHHHQNLQHTKTSTAAAAAATPAAEDVGNINNSNHSNSNDDTTKDWCPIQNALQETVAKHAASPLEVAHARAFCQAQSRFATGSTPWTLKQVAKQVIEMNRLLLYAPRSNSSRRRSSNSGRR